MFNIISFFCSISLLDRGVQGVGRGGGGRVGVVNRLEVYKVVG